FSGVHADIGGGYRLSELGRIPLSYMLTKLSKVFVDDPIAFNPDSISSISHYDLEDDFYLHYHGDGTAKDRRMVAVQDKDEPSARYRPKLHHSVLHFMASTTLQLSTPLNSFSKLEPIQYSPKGVYGLLGKYQKVN
ncbi:MAG: DUF2235 domain-containing protein, partial [Pseudomonadales bacterium]|nr:DUF2235 domain-containing protein [Pseudomonadales bacterium]